MSVDWADAEVATVVDEYLEMLHAELEDRPYVKAEANRAVQEQTGRSRGAVEFKFANISAVLEELGLPWVEGYKPRTQFQAALRSEVQSRIALGLIPWLTGAPVSDFTWRTEGTLETDEDPYWSALARLWSRANGGSDVAAAPDRREDLFWPSGPSAPAAHEATLWFKARAAAADRPAFLFLVGGPGSGKSLAAAQCVADLAEVDRSTSDLAQRTYEYHLGSGSRLLLVNDATISSDDFSDRPLANEIELSLERGSSLLANVNRGILLEENVGMADANAGHAGQVVVSWLLEHEVGRVSSGASAQHVVKTLQDSAFVRAGLLERDGRPIADVVGVFMDVCSLFEERPQADVDAAASEFRATISPYSIERLTERARLDDDSIPAGYVLSDLAATLWASLPMDAPLADPFRANVQSLTSREVRSGVLTSMRAAEIANARRMTYRDLWGAIARLFVGDLTDVVTQPRPREWIESHQPISVDPRQRFEQWALLGNLRFHQALFSARGLSPLKENGASLGPAAQLLTLVDPVRDARAGWTGRSQGWASPILEVFEGLSADSLPLESVRLTLEASDPFNSAITEFDSLLDQAFVNALADARLTDTDRRRNVSWYSGYLTRLYALSNGIPAFREEIDLWTVAWAVAKTPQGVLPDELDQSLRTLLLPPYDPEIPRSPLVLPVFDARTVPITGGADSPRLALRIPAHWSLACRASGDSLFISLRDHDEEIVELELDFPMLREALACKQGHVGVTEYSHLASPRLERFRAALLRPGVGSHGAYVIVNGPEIFELIVEGPHA